MNKSKEISNVSATTAVGLKAELAQHIEDFEKVRSTQGKQVQAQRPKAKATVWTRQNKGVQDRNQRDEQKRLPTVEADVLARSRQQLEKKAKIYEAMRSGQIQYDQDDEEKMPLIDFDRKYLEERELQQSKKESERKKKKRRTDNDDDPWVEFEDEFGRTRIVRRSQLPEHTSSHSDHSDDDEDDSDMAKNSAYAAYRPDFEAADRTDMNHYEADREIRTKGVGFYRFSKDEQERHEQMEKLKQMREETENARKSAANVSSKRKQMMAQNAEKIRARRAALKAKKFHQLKPEEVPQDVHIPAVMNEDIVTDFLKSVRKQVEKD
ncbi:MAG: hypothetical protein EXX96DRAFT_602304 [Benjaminiella poitrasii]|nr:MAG: hypothetical protein EXX96DRAFT_602304 [Benjaminiella poitrasii]